MSDPKLNFLSLFMNVQTQLLDNLQAVPQLLSSSKAVHAVCLELLASIIEDREIDHAALMAKLEATKTKIADIGIPPP